MFGRRRALPPDAEQEGFDMTPMIDVTFQLIIFFMLVSDMSRTRTEVLKLPAASTATRIDNLDDLVVNIQADGTVKIDGRKLGDAALEAVFEGRRPKAERGTGYPVVLRADAATPFEHVQKILMMATDRGAVTRVQFSAKKE
jgi:biopolymer transport protein ExbD